MNLNEKKINLQPELNIKSIRKKNISTKISHCIKSKPNTKLNISKSNSRYFSFINNNTNTNLNITNTNLITNNQQTQESNNNFKKINLKPQINQFEFINKIQNEQKKLPSYKKQNTSRGIEKRLQINDYEPQLSDSFRHINTNINSKINLNIDKNINNEINIKRNSKKKAKKMDDFINNTLKIKEEKIKNEKKENLEEKKNSIRTIKNSRKRYFFYRSKL